MVPKSESYFSLNLKTRRARRFGPPITLKIIRATIKHLGLVLPLFDAYRHFYRQRSNLPGARRFLRERLKRGESVIFLAVARGWRISAPTGRDKNVVLTRRTHLQLLGFVQLYPSFDSVTMRRVWILYDLFVVPTARRSGVAKMLMERARQFAVKTKAKGLILETAVDNRPAQKLYEQLRWKRDTAFHRYYLDL